MAPLSVPNSPGSGTDPVAMATKTVPNRPRRPIPLLTQPPLPFGGRAGAYRCESRLIWRLTPVMWSPSAAELTFTR